METQQEYYYTYYSYEEWGRGYIGSRGCKCLPEDDMKYFGSFSDKIFKPTQKIILKSDYSTREEAYVDEIILQKYYKVVENSHFVNKSYQTSEKFYVPKDQAIKNGKKLYELGLGIHSFTPEQKSEVGKKSIKKIKELGVGIFSMTSDELSIAGKRGSKRAKELGVGIFSMTSDELSIAGKKSYELGLGVHARTKEQIIEDSRKGGKISGKKVASQRWMCLETGFITNAGNLAQYQRARGIDTSKRVRIE